MLNCIEEKTMVNMSGEKESKTKRHAGWGPRSDK
jgi:hypothetical protein